MVRDIQENIGMIGKLSRSLIGRVYILVGHEPVACDDVLEWARWFQTADICIARTTLPWAKIAVSTIFLGLDHQHGEGPQLLFETMVFGGELDGQKDRYSTWEEAERGHQAMIAKVSNVQK